MEHIAHILRKDSLEVRRVNFIQKGDPLIGIPDARLNSDSSKIRLDAFIGKNGQTMLLT